VSDNIFRTAGLDLTIALESQIRFAGRNTAIKVLPVDLRASLPFAIVTLNSRTLTLRSAAFHRPRARPQNVGDGQTRFGATPANLSLSFQNWPNGAHDATLCSA
jgi:hypothetical protein